MIPYLANHLWQSTWFAAAAYLMTLSLRRNGAQVRYRVWLAASLKFLVPFSLLLTAGSRVEWRSVPAMPPPISSAIVQITAPLPAPATSHAGASWPILPGLMLLLWISGSIGVLVRWWKRWRTVRAALRGASRLTIEGPVAVMCSGARFEPGIFGIFRPVLLLPEGIADRLTPAQLQAILAHEFCHVRRRDNLFAFAHMLVEAVFWFHPLVWWIGARLVEERERACDEEVLGQGSDPEVYAAGILKVCRFYLESPLPCAAGVTGADLKRRIESIMMEPNLRSLSRARKALIAAAGIAALGAPILAGIARAQTEAVLRFEVASLKPAKSAGGRGGMMVFPGGGLRMDGASLRSLIAFAYDVREEYITGGPKWAGSDGFDLVAKPEHPAAADNPPTSVAPGTNAWDRMRLRLQTLLAERFQLVVRKKTKETSGYALVQAKGGTKLQASTTQEQAGTMRHDGGIDGRSGTMHMLATVLTGYLGRPVEDRTGLTETYSYKLEYAQEGAPDATGPEIFTALQEQLGLKLETARVKSETVVIERVQRLAGN